VTAAVAKTQKERNEAEAGASEAEEDDKKKATDDTKTKEDDDVPAFQMNLMDWNSSATG
jgi:hypothetical protein